MAFTLYPRDMSQIPDPVYTEAINKTMRVPERLSVGVGRREEGEGQGEPPPTYAMQVPDRLTYTEAPEMSPTPLFKPAVVSGPLGLEPCWENPSGEVFYKEVLQSPIRRSYSDQSFGRTPPSTPTKLKQAPARHPFSSRGSRRPLHQQPAGAAAAPAGVAAPPALQPPSANLSFLSPQSILQTAKYLGLQASQRLLQTVSQKYRAMENWSPEEEGGAAVEFIILRRQVMKMSRRLAALERHNAERRNTEVVLFSLLVSACLLNVWLWIRR